MKCDTGKPIEACTSKDGCLRHTKCLSCGMFHVQEKKQCIFCKEYFSDSVGCQLCISPNCKQPICYSCLEKWWAFNSVHNVQETIQGVGQ